MKTENSKRRTGAFVWGMGAVAPMERSAAAVELLAHTNVIRVANISQTTTSAARLERQIGLCVCVGRLVAAVVVR